MMNKRILNSVTTGYDKQRMVKISRPQSPTISQATLEKHKLNEGYRPQRARDKSKKDDSGSFIIKRSSFTSSKLGSVETDRNAPLQSLPRNPLDQLKQKAYGRIKVSKERGISDSSFKTMRERNGEEPIGSNSHMERMSTRKSRIAALNTNKRVDFVKDLNQQSASAANLKNNIGVEFLNSSSNLYKKINDASNTNRDLITVRDTQQTQLSLTASKLVFLKKVESRAFKPVHVQDSGHQFGPDSSEKKYVPFGRPNKTGLMTSQMKQLDDELYQKLKKPTPKLVLLTGFHFEKKERCKNWRIGQEVKPFIKYSCKKHKETIEEDVSRYRRCLILLTSVRNKELSITYQRREIKKSADHDNSGKGAKPKKTLGDSPDNSPKTKWSKEPIKSSKRKTNPQDDDAFSSNSKKDLLDSDGNDDSSNSSLEMRDYMGDIDNDYSVFRNLRSSIENNIKYKLINRFQSARNDEEFLGWYIENGMASKRCKPSRFSSFQALSSLSPGCSQKPEEERKDKSYKPNAIYKYEEFEVILRRKVNPEFVVSYAGETDHQRLDFTSATAGDGTGGSQENAITLWGYDITRVLTEEVERFIGDGFWSSVPFYTERKILSQDFLNLALHQLKFSVKEPKIFTGRSVSKRDMKMLGKAAGIQGFNHKEALEKSLIADIGDKNQAILNLLQKSHKKNIEHFHNEQRKYIREKETEMFVGYHKVDNFIKPYRMSIHAESSIPHSQGHQLKVEMAGSELEVDSVKKSVSIDREKDHLGSHLLNASSFVLFDSRETCFQAKV